MIKRYTVEYSFHDWQCVIDFNTELFTKEHVTEYLAFFVWSYNKENDPYEEYAKKLAQKIIIDSMELNIEGVKDVFEDAEGFPKLDGSTGVELVYCECWSFDDDDFEIEIEKK